MTDIHAVELPSQWVLPRGNHLLGTPLPVPIRPQLTRFHGIAGEILMSLGKRSDVAGKGRNQQQDVTLAQAWLRAHRTPALLIHHAERLHPTMLPTLISFGQRAGTSLWLLHSSRAEERFHRALRRHNVPDAPLGDVPAVTEIVPPTPAPSTTQPATPLPRDDFHVFLARCRDNLPHRDHARVTERLRTRIDDLARHFAALPPHRAVEAGLHDILQHAPTDNDLITDVRAIQLTAWNHGHHVQVDLDRLLASEERPRTGIADLDQALAVYKQPYRAIIVVLSLHRVGLREAQHITTADVHDDGTRFDLTQRRITVGPHTAAAVRAAVHLAEQAGTTTLLPQPERALSNALRDAATDLGIHTYGRRCERSIRPGSWLRQLGITVRPLT